MAKLQFSFHGNLNTKKNRHSFARLSNKVHSNRRRKHETVVFPCSPYWISAWNSHCWACVWISDHVFLLERRHGSLLHSTLATIVFYRLLWAERLVARENDRWGCLCLTTWVWFWLFWLFWFACHNASQVSKHTMSHCPFRTLTECARVFANVPARLDQIAPGSAQSFAQIHRQAPPYCNLWKGHMKFSTIKREKPCYQNKWKM